MTPFGKALRAYHEVILAPFLYDEDFDFAAWRLRSEMQRFLLRHPNFLRLVPPAEAILPARVMSGIKGLLTKLGARMNTYRMSIATAAGPVHTSTSVRLQSISLTARPRIVCGSSHDIRKISGASGERGVDRSAIQTPSASTVPELTEIRAPPYTLR